MDINQYVEYFSKNKKEYKTLMNIYNSGKMELQALSDNLRPYVAESLKRFNGWSWFVMVFTTMGTRELASSKLDPFNIFEYAAQYQYSVSWDANGINFDNKKGKQASYPIKECIPVISDDPNKERAFVNIRGALEVSAIKPGYTHDPMSIMRREEAQAVLSVENYCEALGYVAEVESPSKIAFESAKKIYDEVKSVPESTAVFKAVHTKLVEDAVLLAKESNIENFCDDDGHYEIKGKMVPAVSNLTQPMVQQYLHSSRSYRKEDGAGLSGISNGYSLGLVVNKTMSSVLEELELLRRVRAMFSNATILVYGISHLAKMYAITNVRGPVVYAGKIDIEYSHYHCQRVYMPPESKRTVLLNYRMLQVSIGKSMTLPEREKAFLEVFKRDISSQKFYRVQRAMYVTHVNEYHLLPSRNYHNMVVYYTNLERKSIPEKGKAGGNTKPKLVLEPHVVPPDTLLTRMYLANYIRNNWFHCAMHFGKIISYYEGKESKDFLMQVDPPYVLEEKSVKQFTFNTIDVDSVKLDKIVQEVDVVKAKKKEFNVSLKPASTTTTTSRSVPAPTVSSLPPPKKEEEHYQPMSLPAQGLKRQFLGFQKIAVPSAPQLSDDDDEEPPLTGAFEDPQ